jgi:hypothetical protein
MSSGYSDGMTDNNNKKEFARYYPNFSPPAGGEEPGEDLENARL